MDEQNLFNLVVAVAGLLAGWIMRVIWSRISGLEARDRKLTDRVSEMETLVAGTYIPRAEHTRTMERVFNKLDCIERKIDKKADRQ